MNIKQKLTRKDGSALTLAIILTALFLIISSIIMSQINNQIRSNSKMYKDAQNKYQAEGNIEVELAQIYASTKSAIDGLSDNCSITTTGKHTHDNIVINGIHGGRTISAKIKVEVANNGYKTITEKEIDLTNLKNVQIESTVNNYKVAILVDFGVDDLNNLLYNVKSYNKQPLN